MLLQHYVDKLFLILSSWNDLKAIILKEEKEQCTAVHCLSFWEYALKDSL